MKNLILPLALAATLGTASFCAPMSTVSASKNMTVFMPVVEAKNEITLHGVNRGQITLRTDTPKAVEIYGRSVISLYVLYRPDKEQKNVDGVEVLIDPYRREYRTFFTNKSWLPISKYEGPPKTTRTTYTTAISRSVLAILRTPFLSRCPISK